MGSKQWSWRPGEVEWDGETISTSPEFWNWVEDTVMATNTATEITITMTGGGGGGGTALPSVTEPENIPRLESLRTREI
jgi:hypothetical protein